MSFGSQKYANFSTFVSGLNSQVYEWDTQVQIHTCEELMLISQPGSCTIVNNGNTVTVQTPAFIWNRAGSYHYFPQIPNTEDAIIATFYPQILKEIPKGLLKADFMEDCALFVLPLNGKHLKRMLRLFLSLLGSPYFQRQFLFPCVFHQVSQAISEGLKPIRIENANDYIFEVIEMLQQIGPERHTAKSVAAKFHVGKTKLNDDFKKITSLSVHEYRLEHQLQAARAKLASSKTPLVQIATDCGFTDESHLIRAFRAKYGLTPGAFRKKYMASFRLAAQNNDPQEKI